MSVYWAGESKKITYMKFRAYNDLVTILKEQRVFSYAISSPNYFNFTTFGWINKSPLEKKS